MECENKADAEEQHLSLSAFYMSRGRVLGLLNHESLPPQVLTALMGQDNYNSGIILSNMMGSYLFNAIDQSNIKTLDQLAFEDTLNEGVQFIYHGMVRGKGFGFNNKSPALSLTAKPGEPLKGRTLIVNFSKDGILNNTAYTRMTGLTRLFIFGYIAGIEGTNIRAIPYVTGDLVTVHRGLPLPFNVNEIRPEDIEQFADMNSVPSLSPKQRALLKNIPERTVKELICRLLDETSIPKDWGGEESDIFSSNLLINGHYQTGAFLLKGPAKFHEMKPTDLGKNGDQLYRLFNIPADIYIIQHCCDIGPAVRGQAEAFALRRSLTKTCKLVFMDGNATGRLLQAHGLLPTE